MNFWINPNSIHSLFHPQSPHWFGKWIDAFEEADSEYHSILSEWDESYFRTARLHFSFRFNIFLPARRIYSNCLRFTNHIMVTQKSTKHLLKPAHLIWFKYFFPVSLFPFVHAMLCLFLVLFHSEWSACFIAFGDTTATFGESNQKQMPSHNTPPLKGLCKERIQDQNEQENVCKWKQAKKKLKKKQGRKLLYPWWIMG